MEIISSAAREQGSLAGVECNDDAKAPDGWTKWRIPGYEYICVEREREGCFPESDGVPERQRHSVSGGQSAILPARRQGKIICIFLLRSYEKGTCIWKSTKYWWKQTGN